MPTGIESETLDALRNALADCAEWQSWTGFPGDPSSAKGRIHKAKAASLTRPFAVISPLDYDVRTFGKYPAGTLGLYIEAAVAPADAADPTAALESFTDRAGTVIEQLGNLGQQAGYLVIRQIQRVHIARSQEEELDAGEGDYYQAYYNVHYGLEN